MKRIGSIDNSIVHKTPPSILSSQRTWKRNLMVNLLSFPTAVLLCGFPSPAQMDQDSILAREKVIAVADAVVRDATFQFIDRQSGRRYAAPSGAPADAELGLESQFNDWRYWNGVINIGMVKLGEALRRTDYTRFAVRNIAFSFDNYRYFQNRYAGQAKWEYPLAQRFIMEELDDYGAMGASVIEVMRLDHNERYKEYALRAGEYLLTQQHRLPDRTLVRSFPRQWTIWADDLYMSVSLLSRLGELTGDNRYWDDAGLQVIKFHERLFNREKGMMVHCWFSGGSRSGVAFWGRANGWALLAQADLLDRLPSDHPLRSMLLDLFRQHLLGIARYQGAEGLWHQLLDKPDSYLETSCSAMFTYAFAHAVNRGVLDAHFASIARRGWEGVMSKIRADGEVEGVCAGTSVSDDLVSYYRRPTPLNDPHGIGAVLLAGVEMLDLPIQSGD